MVVRAQSALAYRLALEIGFASQWSRAVSVAINRTEMRLASQRRTHNQSGLVSLIYVLPIGHILSFHLENIFIYKLLRRAQRTHRSAKCRGSVHTMATICRQCY